MCYSACTRYQNGPELFFGSAGIADVRVREGDGGIRFRLSRLLKLRWSDAMECDGYAEHMQVTPPLQAH
jgi:hypothetical protein